MKIFILTLSFLLEGVFSAFLPANSIFYALLSLVALIIVYPYYNGKVNNYYITAFIYGFMYDLIYTNTIVFNAFLFLLISNIIVRLDRVLSFNYVNLCLTIIICIVIFRSLSYGALLMTGNLNFNFDEYLNSILNSLLITIIYGILLRVVTNLISKKFKIKKYRN